MDTKDGFNSFVTSVSMRDQSENFRLMSPEPPFIKEIIRLQPTGKLAADSVGKCVTDWMMAGITTFCIFRWGNHTHLQLQRCCTAKTMPYLPSLESPEKPLPCKQIM